MTFHTVIAQSQSRLSANKVIFAKNQNTASKIPTKISAILPTIPKILNVILIPFTILSLLQSN